MSDRITQRRWALHVKRVGLLGWYYWADSIPAPVSDVLPVTFRRAGWEEVGETVHPVVTQTGMGSSFMALDLEVDVGAPVPEVAAGDHSERPLRLREEAAREPLFGALELLPVALELRERIGPRGPGPGKGRTGTISLCMIVKNEEQHLARCLQSAKGAVDEIIVVDTGSTDRTREIARSYGAKVHEFPWTGSFAEALSFS